MGLALVAGALAGLVLGYVLQRGQLCFHSVFRGMLERRPRRFHSWALGVAVAAVGLALQAELVSEPMSSSLALRPLNNIAGGLVFGIGMAVAASCVSGLFYKLGAGMLGALVGLAGWAAGELLANQVSLGGDRVLAGRETLPTLLGLPRLVVAAAVAAVVIVVLARRNKWRWGRLWIGVALGLAAIWTWITAGVAGVDFGASTVGAVTGLTRGNPNWWQVAFLVALVPGATIAARTAGGFRLRGEVPVRYVQLAAGGVLLGAGARWAGGCNLGHGLSGMAQLNLSSMLVVASMIAGIAVARAVQVRLGTRGPRHDPAYRSLHRTPRPY